METLLCDAILFDLDGVLVDSTVVVERHWRQWAERNELDPEEVVRIAHGRRTVETIGRMTPHLDAEEEAARLSAEEGADTEGLKVIPGAEELLHALPEDRWAVATSCMYEMAETRLVHMGLPWPPPALVTAEDVERGKPAPEVYLRAARQVGVAPERCVVVEDTPIGVEAAHAAGMQAVGVTTNYTPEELSEADAVVSTLRDLRVEGAAKAAGPALVLRVETGVKRRKTVEAS